MQDTTQLRHNHPEQIQAHDRGIPREEERILATVPSRMSIERYGEDGPPPEVYRQALKSILATPELESRLNYITASMIVTMFGGWLAGKMIRTRAFIFFTDIILLFASLALAGFLVGVMLGEGFLPPATAPVLLFVTVGLALLLVGIVLGNMILGAHRNSREQSDDGSFSRTIIFPARKRRSYPGHAKTI